MEIIRIVLNYYYYIYLYILYITKMLFIYHIKNMLKVCLLFLYYDKKVSVIRVSTYCKYWNVNNWQLYYSLLILKCEKIIGKYFDFEYLLSQ